ncbi:mu-like prophage FluMu host-nuclease inhibitor protein gam [Lepeophtheirus salmonis]|uniref:mu-like prophage FluMu host-nuclease inhibitor protein gam n=1 Tax=Lepeophtheirus salmonis TaxID=72036 RepID=UPI001AEA8D43|nr:mu-like prophage FluMu host-nuclease inhibitor protein gam [Lepeophtheirus salmonis]
MNDAIADITDKHKPTLNDLQARAKELQIGIQAWCEAHRDDLTNKSKTANLITGEISWRQRPPSISLRGIDTILENLRSLGLARFIRTKDEINKDAMLNEADVAASVAGVTIKTGVEDFIIKPFEANIEE